MRYLTTLAILIIVLLIAFMYMNPNNNKNTVKLAGQVIEVEVADTVSKKFVGLGGREALAHNQGMLFVYESLVAPEFWMKDMLIPIDIIWISGQEVVDITPAVPPEPGVPDSDLKRYPPVEPIDKVLEVRSGWAEEFGLQIGDEVEFDLP